VKGLTYGAVTRDILRPLFKPSAAYFGLLGLCIAMLAVGGYAFLYQLRWGLGLAGYSPPVMWGVYIVTFVFWVGIGHAGTLISAILFLVRSRWRTGVYRASEAMTVFAVMTALLFPVLHLGRCWQVYWFFPYPNQRQLWMNFKSPLMWDVFAISTYFTVSAVFFFVGCIPDVASFRDHSKGLVKTVYNILCLGWRGTNTQWHAYMAAYGFFAAFAAPLVLSVHSVVSWDFAMAPTAGWHSTIFPPYFVAGAIFSGCAMVINLLMPMTIAFKWDEYVNTWHYESLAKMCLLTSAILTYAYGMEYLFAWYSREPLRAGHLLLARHRRLRLGLLGHGVLQLHRAPALVDPRAPPQLRGPVHHLDLRQHRDVVRALQHRRELARPQLRPGDLDLLLAHRHRVGHHHRILRLVRHVVRHVHEGHAERGGG
jgi:Ni/Fe-hydrogenase subunit HybB-like protein